MIVLSFPSIILHSQMDNTSMPLDINPSLIIAVCLLCLCELMVVIIQQACDLIIMNVRGDESQRRLNYYSRSSPKKKKNHLYAHSPLLSSTPTRTAIRSNNHSHIRSQPASLQTSFRLDVHEVALSTSCHEILIEESDQEDILIEDEPVQLPDPHARVIISASQNEQPQEINQLPQITQDRVPLIKNNDIRIQDDQNNQVEEREERQQRGPGQDFIRIENQQLDDTHQTMSRQFTFGQEFVEAQKAEIEEVPLPTTNQEDEYSSPATSARPEKETETFNEDMPYFQSNMEYEAESRRKPELDLDLVEASSSFDELYDDYQSPKFNAVPLVKSDDKWITAEDYHFLASPKKQERGEILIESDRPSSKSSARVSLSSRPFGECISLLSDIMQQIPEQLKKTYEQMHRKLVADQIKAEQELQRQQDKIKILRMLLLLRKKGVKCEEFLLAGRRNEQQQIQLNKIMIHSLIKRFTTQPHK